MKAKAAAAVLLLAALAGVAAGQTQAKAQAQGPAKVAAPASSPDFSGTWKLDPAASANVSPNMKGAVLVVEQKGDHIQVTPPRQGAGKILLAAEEIIADGQPYEKSVGGGKAVVTARWSADRKTLELELKGTEPEKKLEMVQTSRWSLSPDGSTWLRETRTTGDGKLRTTRLVFRRQQTEPPPTKSAPTKPPKS